MNVYDAYYHESFGWGAYTEHHYTVVANTDSEALGLALDAEPDSHAGYWRIQQIDTTVPCARHIVTDGT